MSGAPAGRADTASVPTPSDVAFVFDPALSAWELAPDHPFKPVRLDLVKTLLESWGLLSEDQVVPVERLHARELERVHHPAYIAAVRAASRGDRSDEIHRYGLGTLDTPIWAGMHDAVAHVCAASATAVRTVLDGRARRAVSFAGGLHHAMPARASGFCVYSDLAIAITRATDRGLRVACLDLDVHHGDGVQEIFYDRPDVLTLSLHESGRYLFPGGGHTHEVGRDGGRGTNVNLPLEPFTEDDSYLEVFELVVPRALRAFRPDLIVLQAGADAHRSDPLADLSLTLTGMRDAYRRVVALADELCGGRLVVTGGGGYDAWRTAPRAWAQVWAALCGRDTPMRTPSEWRERWNDRADRDLPERALDGPLDHEPQPRRRLVRSHNLAVARRLLEVLTPIWAEHEGLAESAAPPGGTT